MAAVNANILTKTLRIGVDEPLYVGTNASPSQAGAVQTTGTLGTAPVYGCFGLPPQSSNYRGTVWFEAIPIGGTVTALTFQVEASFDGVTWRILNRLGNYGASPATLAAYSGIAFGTLASGAIIGVDLSGLGGAGLLRLNFTTVTLGTGTGADIYAHTG